MAEIDLDELDQVLQINLIVEDINKLLAKCRHLVGSFKHSGQLKKLLYSHQTELQYETKIKLVQDISIRWNSTYDMCDSICINQDALIIMSSL